MTEKKPCSTCHEMVQWVVDKYPHFKSEDGTPNLDLILYTLGFDVYHSVLKKGYVVLKDKYIRDANNPHRVFISEALYNGQIRNYRYVLRNGEQVLVPAEHPLTRLHDEKEVLMPLDVEEYLSSVDGKDIFTDISEIGFEKAYNDGFNAMDKPKKQSDRHIAGK